MIMKRVFVFILAIIILCLNGCAANLTNTESNNGNISNAGNTSTTYREQEHQSPTKDYILNPNINANDWMSIDLPEVGLNNLTIGTVVEGHVTKYDIALPVYIFCDYARYGNGNYCDAYLAVVTESRILFKDLADDNDSGSYGSTLYLRDVDGDKVDEIIIQQTVEMSGGAGAYVSRIYKVIEDEIREIFNSSSEDYYDTGFTSVLKDGFKLEIKNQVTEYKTTLDISAKKEYVGMYFDETGKVINDEMISCDSFFEFAPEDVDGDGVFEIACLQYVSLYGHADYIGNAKSVLKFNLQKQEFEIIQAEFKASI